ncbi:PASTA domain-containing protein, partial [bacterium]|nr:PASTA domain-containing protein [bacterium]
NKGSFTVQGRTISEAEAHEKFEWISLKKMIQVSSNVVAAKLALKVGADQYLKTLQSLGIGSKSGVGFPGEISGRIPARKQWQPLTLANIGFGQGVLVTPIQMLRAYAAFLNGGWLVDPVLVSGDSQASRQAPRRVLSPAAADGVLAALSAVTEEGGTGGKAVLDGYRVAGKTGTAQTVDPTTGKYSRSHYIPSFIGFATGVEPKLVIFTSLDGPRGIYYASETAAPLFRGVLNAVVNRFSIPSDPKLVRQRLSPPQSIAASQDTIDVNQAHSTLPIVRGAVHAEARPGEEEAIPSAWNDSESSMGWKMPSLIGLTAREALRALQGRPYEIELDGRGLVRSQRPEPGKTVAGRTTVRLNLSPQ